MSPADNVEQLGSDEATTCCLLFLESDSSYAVAHLDNSLKLETLKQLVGELIGQPAGSQFRGQPANQAANAGDRLHRLTCKLVGSYNDEKRNSLKFLNRLFGYLHSVPAVQIELRLACLLDANTKRVARGDQEVNCPIFYGAAVDLATNELRPAEFADRGPEIILRNARRSCQAKDLVQVYHSNSRLFVINEFRYFRISSLDFLINAPDQYLLDNFSTSPLVEPPHFADATRQMFALMKTDKVCEPTHRFRREPDGKWTEVDS